jgi:diguanylate cyclase (GGDEF)-like protein
MRMIHRIRAGGSLLGLAILGSHLQARDAGALAWLLAALQFLVYPHLVYLYTRRAANPFLAGLHNFLLDAMLLGLWSAALGYPLWIAFALLICNLVSVMLYHGPRSTALAAATFLLPGLAWLLATGTALQPQTSTLTTLLSAVGLTGFLLMVSHMNFRRTAKLRDTREALRRSEQALQQQLAEIHVLQARLSEQANRDPLTGLYNRRYLDSTLDRELARCQREGQPLSLMLIDLDHFKKINDTYGHQAGDEVLRQLADMLGAQARMADVACRYGGEEFLLLLPGMTQAVAMDKAERWRTEFSQNTIAFGEFRLQATLSIGVATYPGHGTTAQSLIRSADEALYLAKTGGRNRVAACAQRVHGS